jgi:hypothetical protein
VDRATPKKNAAAAAANDALRNRIIGHRTVPARDLIPHALNPRTHGPSQREALRAMLDDLGLARSLLAYVADAHKHLGESAPLTLIDGHLRADELADAAVTVEVLDVNDEEAKKLLLTMDPLAALAGYDEERLDALRATVSTNSDALANLWASVADAQKAASRVLDDAAKKRKESRKGAQLEEKYLVIVACRDERHQVEVLRQCQQAGHTCKAVMS